MGKVECEECDVDPITEEAWSFREKLCSQARLAYAMSAEDATDLVQDVYVKVWRFRDRFEAGTSMWGWLSTIMHHTFVNAYRRERKRQRGMERWANARDNRGRAHLLWPEFVLAECSVFVEEDFLFYGVGDPLRGCLLALSNDQRQALLLDARDYSGSEIAQALGCPLGTANSRLDRARKGMQKSLDEGKVRPARQ